MDLEVGLSGTSRRFERFSFVRPPEEWDAKGGVFRSGELSMLRTLKLGKSTFHAGTVAGEDMLILYCPNRMRIRKVSV